MFKYVPMVSDTFQYFQSVPLFLKMFQNTNTLLYVRNFRDFPTCSQVPHIFHIFQYVFIFSHMSLSRCSYLFLSVLSFPLFPYMFQYVLFLVSQISLHVPILSELPIFTLYSFIFQVFHIFSYFLFFQSFQIFPRFQYVPICSQFPICSDIFNFSHSSL